MLVRDFQNARTPLAWWRPWLIPSPTPHGTNYWKVPWGAEHPFDDKDAAHPPWGGDWRSQGRHHARGV